MKNGKLFARASAENFDALITMENEMVSRQNLSKFKLAIVAPRAKSNRLADTSPLLEKVLAVLATLKSGKVVKVSPWLYPCLSVFIRG